MSAGYWCGRLFGMEVEARRRMLVRPGAGLTAAFLIVRGLIVYADPAPWSRQPSVTALSFLNCTK
jgi:hypothetical protein